MVPVAASDRTRPVRRDLVSPSEEEVSAVRRPTLYAVRFLIFIVVLAAASLLLPSPGQHSPYLSALTIVSAPAALAQSCGMSSCGRDKEGQLICTPSGTLTNCTSNRSGHRCSTTNC